MNLLPGEKILLQSDNNAFILTSHRVRMGIQTTGFSKVTSIMLDELSTCEITAISRPWLLVAALLIFLIGLFSSLSNTPFSRNDPSGIFGGAVIALIFVLTYFATRQKVISLRSSSGAINVATKGMSMENATALINTVEAARNDRYFSAGNPLSASA